MHLLSGCNGMQGCMGRIGIRSKMCCIRSHSFFSFFFFRDGHSEIPAIAMLVMALGVGAAAIAAQAVYSSHFYSLSSNRKSLKDLL